MNQHHHDPDRIMALAEGHLDAADAPRAEAEMQACARCAEDLALQRVALDALRAAEPVALTELERARLHRTVLAEVRPVEAPTRPARRDARRFRLVAAMGSVAAVLIAVVAIGPRLGGFGASDDAADTTAAAAIAADTEAPSTEAPAAALEERDGTAEPAETMVAAAPEASQLDYTAQVRSLNLQTYADNAELNLDEIAAELESQLVELGTLTDEPPLPEGVAGEDVGVAPFDAQACQDAAALALIKAGASAVVDYGQFEGRDVVVIAYLDFAAGTVDVVAHDLDTCEILARSD
jgi:hypothetical protein